MIEKLRIEAASVISTRTVALLLKIFESLFESLGKLHLGTPAEFLFCARRRDDRSLLFARTFCRVHCFSREIGDARKGRIKVVHVGLDAGANVHRDSRCAGLRRRYHGSHHIADVNVVARLRAVAVDRHRLAVEYLAAKYRDYARLAMRVLPRAVHVAESQ